MVAFGRGSRGRRTTRSRGSSRPAKGAGAFASRVRSLSTDSESRAGSSEEDRGDVPETASPSESDVTEDEAAPTARAYNALLDNLKSSKSINGEPSKKRKLNGSSRYPVGNIVSAVGDFSDEPANLGTQDQTEPEQLSGLPEADDGLLLEEDGENQEDSEVQGIDPYDAHLSSADEELLFRRIKAAGASKWLAERLDIASSSRPGKTDDSITISYSSTLDAQDRRRLLPSSHTSHDLRSLRLRQKIAAQAAQWKLDISRISPRVVQGLFDYRDLIYPNRNVDNAPLLRQLTCLHCMNHVLRNRNKVLKNNALMAQSKDEDLELRDQGFTRPKILFLLPTRQSCARVVSLLSFLYGAEQEENKKRFQEAFVANDETFSGDKPPDFRDLFGGNDDDMFRIGLKFTRKTLKYFSQFYTSDIILASPLGLKLAINASDGKAADNDFLSSIEVVVVDQAEALLMQNWEHVEEIFENLNLQPKEAHGCDFNRVKYWYLDGKAQHLRQTIVLSAFKTPDLKRLATRHIKNVDGVVELHPVYEGEIQQFQIRIRQIFTRFDTSSPFDEPDSRFDHFSSAIVPTIVREASSKGSSGSGILIFIPSYLDFVRVRNYFATSTATHNMSFGSISEYSEVSEMTRARSHFFSGRHSVLLYSERAHHFRRFQVRGVKQVIMYGLPDNPLFYKEIVGGCLSKTVAEGKTEEGVVSCKCIFSKYDAMKLERIVGTSRYLNLIMHSGDTFDFA